jgi:hypothetical protein
MGNSSGIKPCADENNMIEFILVILALDHLHLGARAVRPRGGVECYYVGSEKL